MTDQLDLFNGAAPRFTIDYSRPLPIQRRFEIFHEANPWVYAAVVKVARDLVQRGHRKVGLKMCFEVLRWSWIRATDDPNSDWKLNNNFTSRYARLIEAQEADLVGVFETRQLKAA